MSKEIKKLIIKNFIDRNWSNEEVREMIKTGIDAYVEKDHVDEIAQAGFHKVDDHINLYAEDYRGDTWEEICKICGVSSEVTEMMIPFAKALIKTKE
jgi:anaerobic selenocysteine-containing dehydrogenase